MEQEVAWSLVVSSWWPSYLMGPLLYGQILAQIKQANGSPLLAASYHAQPRQLQ